MIAEIAKKVLIATNEPFAESARKEAVELLADAGHVADVLEKYGDKKILLEKAKDANVIIVRSDIVDQEVIDAASKLELIVRGGSGVDNVKVNFDELRERGIYVMNTPGMNSLAVAEHVFTLALSNMRKVIPAHNALVLEGKSIKKQATGTELFGKKIGIYGFGYIGEIVAQIANGFGMEVFTYDNKVSSEHAKEKGAKMVKSLDELCDGTFLLTLHVSLNDFTRKAVNEEGLKRMAKDGILVNAARDDIVDRDSIIKVLAERPRFRYATDFGEENRDIESQFPGRVLLTPHTGASTFEANYRTIVAAAKQVIDFYLKDDDSCVLNRDVVPHYLKNYADLAFRLGLLSRALVHGSVSKVATVCYSDLNLFSKAFTEKIVKGLFAGESGQHSRPEDFNEYLKNIETVIKDPDKTKGYGNSLTADVFTQNGEFSSVSLRGAMSENSPVLTRVEDFNHLNFTPEGAVVFFMYYDKPGKMDFIGRYFTELNYNKSNIRAAQSIDKKRALAIIQVEKNIEPGAMHAELSSLVSRVLKEDSDVYHAAFVNFD